PKLLCNGQQSCSPTLLKRTWRAERTFIQHFATTKGRSANLKWRVPDFLTILASSSSAATSSVARASPKKDYVPWNRRWHLIHAILTHSHSCRLATRSFDVTPK